MNGDSIDTMHNKLTIGMEYEISNIITYEMTAEHYKSGNLPVYATPCMISHMEQAAMLSVQSKLSEGFTTVGTNINVKHSGASPVGMTAATKAVLKEIDGRRLVFDVTASDDIELIGKGTHERFIVFADKFMKKVSNKSDK